MPRPLYAVDINFDEASKAWRKNKKRHDKSKSTYYYLCSEPKCRKQAYVSESGAGFGRIGFCKMHWIELLD